MDNPLDADIFDEAEFGEDGLVLCDQIHFDTLELHMTHSITRRRNSQTTSDVNLNASV